MKNTFLILIIVFGLPNWSAFADDTPPQILKFLKSNCLDCHDGDHGDGGVNLNVKNIDWQLSSNLAKWESVLHAVKDGVMPPKGMDQPDKADAARFTQWTHDQLVEHSRMGGTPIRRLSGKELQRSIQHVFGINFKLPTGYPQESYRHSFDREAGRMSSSPALMQAYQESAESVVTAFFPVPPPPLDKRKIVSQPKDFGSSQESAKLIDGKMRIASAVSRVSFSTTWPANFAAHQSGEYELSFSVSPHGQDAAPAVLEIRACSAQLVDGDIGQMRLLHKVELKQGTKTDVKVKVELYQGEVPLFYYANSSLVIEREGFKAYLESFFDKHPAILAAWLSVGLRKPAQHWRGAEGWATIAAAAKSLTPVKRSEVEGTDKYQELMKRMLSPAFSIFYADSFIYHHFKHGTAIDVHGSEIIGPIKQIKAPAQKLADTNRARFLKSLVGYQEMSDKQKEHVLRGFFHSTLTGTFRRPATKEEHDSFVQLVRHHEVNGAGFNEGMKQAIRAMVTSPKFLFRGNWSGQFTDHDLANRLSYFLTSGSADGYLYADAAKGSLSRDPSLLVKHAKRLLKPGPSRLFREDFTKQWLHLDKLSTIMPDPSFGFNFVVRIGVEREPIEFFSVMLDENRPIRDFIDPDFVFTSPLAASRIYGLKALDPKIFAQHQNQPKRIPLTTKHPNRGLLGMAAVMMATANGVDTEPVHRGVWALDVLLGRDIPPPPDDVPAITPDTTGAKSPRDLLALHVSGTGCASCHRHIDPLGIVLENYNPIGTWRDQYPKLKTKINPETVLFDGTKISNPEDLRQWLLGNIDQFATGLGNKLLEYATGRKLSYRERDEIRQIVTKLESESRLNTLDFICELIKTETFRTR